MPIEIVPKARIKEKKPASSLMIVFLLITMAMGMNFGLLKYYQYKWNKDLTTIKELLAKKKVEEIEKLESEILLKKQKIDLFQKIFSKHIKTSSVLIFLKDACHKNVYFKEIKWDTAPKKLEILGVAENFRVLAEQIAILQESKFVFSVDLKEVRINPENGKIDFKIEIIFNNNLFFE